MDRCLSSVLFTTDFSADRTPSPSYRLTTAGEVGFKEEQLQDAIERNVELVLAPCRAGGLIDEDERWKFWKREFSVEDAGGIDLLLVSEFGRVAIVETKLSYNPDARRRVLAQVLEYAVHLPFSSMGRLPPIPKRDDGQRFVDQETVQDKLQEGDYLLIIAGDRLDSRAVRLGEVLLGRHLVRAWDLALVEIAVFRRETEPNDSGLQQLLLVPHLRGVLAAEQRQVVRVVVEGDRTRVSVDPTAPVGRPRWTEEKFFAAAESAGATLRDFANGLRRLRYLYSGVTLDFGSAKEGSLILRKEGINILEFYLASNGSVAFRPRNDAGEDNFAKALGEERGLYYRQRLEALFPHFPHPMDTGTPLAYFQRHQVEQVLPLLEEVLMKSASEQGASQTATLERALADSDEGSH